MFKLIVSGNTYAELGEKLIEAAAAHAGKGAPEEDVKLPRVDSVDLNTVKEDNPAKFPLKDDPATPSVLERATSITGLDSNNISWDVRIHSTSKTKTKKGAWKNRRNLDPVILAQVEAELKDYAAGPEPVIPVDPPPIAATALAAPPTVAVAPVPAPPDLGLVGDATPIPTPPPIAVTTPAVTQTVTQPAAPVQPSHVPGDIKPAHSLETFKASAVTVIAALIQQGRITPEYVEQLKTYFKVAELFEIFKNDDQVSELFENFCNAKLINKVA